jgi:mono/diheme cytochrome c family protein
MKPNRQRILVIGILILAPVILAGCQGKKSEPPTATPLPIFEYTQPTEPPSVATAAAAAANNAPEIDPTAVARGANNYERLECFTCHGENGAGGAGSIGDKEAPPLTGLTLTEDEFIDWMRTGGTLGNDHLFSTNRLSESGGKNLYQYLRALGSESEAPDGDE